MKTTLSKFVCALGLLLPFGSFAFQNDQDSVTYKLETGFLYSADENLPFYLHSNRNGIFDYDFNGPVLSGSLFGKTLRSRSAYLQFGIETVILNQGPAVSLQQAYVNYRVGHFLFSAGKQQKPVDSNTFPEMGDFGISNNARPIPKIGVSFPEYWTLPFGWDLFAVKGTFYHGWFENNGNIEKAFLHEKSLFVTIGSKKFFLEGGINHYAIWSGRVVATGENLYQGFGDFLKVISGRGRPELPGGERNGLGSHLGYWHFGLNYRLEKFSVELYNKSLFEDGRSWQFWNLPESKDRIVGLNFNFKGQSEFKIDKVSLQFMTTKDQQGAGLPDRTDEVSTVEENFGYFFGGRDDTYNNFLYTDGWTRFDRPIGNPLFIDRALSQFYFGDIADYGVAIVNNRFTAFHLGVTGEYKDVKFKFLSTFSKNFGTYAGLYEGRYSWEGIQTDPNFEYAFHPALKQVYLLLEASMKPFKNDNWTAGLSLGYDTGQITNNVGAYLKIAYSGLLKGN